MIEVFPYVPFLLYYLNPSSFDFIYGNCALADPVAARSKAARLLGLRV